MSICVALSLTVVALRMAKRQVVVKNLATVEMLGCMSVLCSDKTGALTTGKMVVQNIAFLDHHCSVKVLLKKLAESSSPTDFAALKVVHQIARLCNAAKFDAPMMDRLIEDRAVYGDPTDTALLRFSGGFSVPALDIDTGNTLKAWRRQFGIPFNSRNKWAMTIVSDKDRSFSHIATEHPTRRWHCGAQRNENDFPPCKTSGRVWDNVYLHCEPSACAEFYHSSFHPADIFGASGLDTCQPHWRSRSST